MAIGLILRVELRSLGGASLVESESESRSVLSDSLRPRGWSMESSRPENWSG